MVEIIFLLHFESFKSIFWAVTHCRRLQQMITVTFSRHQVLFPQCACCTTWVHKHTRTCKYIECTTRTFMGCQQALNSGWNGQSLYNVEVRICQDFSCCPFPLLLIKKFEDKLCGSVALVSRLSLLTCLCRLPINDFKKLPLKPYQVLVQQSL